MKLTTMYQAGMECCGGTGPTEQHGQRHRQTHEEADTAQHHAMRYRGAPAIHAATYPPMTKYTKQ